MKAGWANNVRSSPCIGVLVPCNWEEEDSTDNDGARSKLGATDSTNGTIELASTTLGLPAACGVFNAVVSGVQESTAARTNDRADVGSGQGSPMTSIPTRLGGLAELATLRG